jgi:hypothetical protein
MMSNTVTHFFIRGTSVTTLGHEHETAREFKLSGFSAAAATKSVNVRPTIAWCQLNMADDIDPLQGTVFVLQRQKNRVLCGNRRSFLCRN